ncbi:hypothetical protein [Balneatrix alpica]|uniref:hypothetical protein n=1 Tax=Balneatrix alpica TaxID=75684 RepID=UPI002738C2CE|nr:hypothetical protein [Balneatrix alpica]
MNRWRLKAWPVLAGLLSGVLSGCAWQQSTNEVLYIDDGDVAYLDWQTALAQDAEIRSFPQWAALSKSVYLDAPDASSEAKKAEHTNSLERFCSDEDAYDYRPAGWQEITHELQELQRRRHIHQQDLKLGIRLYLTPLEGARQRLILVFRGTNFDEKEDWRANLRWVARFFSFQLDQYDEVRILVPKIVAEARQRYPQIDDAVALGHSLGGGLAHLAGYASHYVTQVYAFDSSPVTGFYDIDGGERRYNAQGMKIYRIYEHGEVLAYLRLLMKGLYPISQDHPDIVQVRFNFAGRSGNGQSANVIKQHSMFDLTCALQQAVSQHSVQ